MNSPKASPSPSKPRNSRSRKTLIHARDFLLKEKDNQKAHDAPPETKPNRAYSLIRNKLTVERLNEERMEKIRSILQKEDRTIEEGGLIHNMLKTFPIFRTIAEHDEELVARFIYPLCAMMEYKTVKANTVLYLESEPTDQKIYILLTGEVNIYKKADFSMAVQRIITNNRQRQMEETRTLIFESSKRSKITSELKYKYLFVNIMTQIENSRRLNFVHPNTRLGALASGKGSKYGLLREIITPGKHFGDTSMHNDKNKSFTAMTASDCELFVVNRQDLIDLIEKIETKRKEVEEFARFAIPGVTSITSYKVLQSLVYIIEEITLPKGALLTKEDEPGDIFYIIKSGEVEIYKKIFMGVNPDAIPTSNSHRENSASKRQMFEDVEIYRSTKGGYIGDEIFINSTGKYHYTTRVASHTIQCFKISKAKFTSKAPEQVLERVIVYCQSRHLGFQELLDAKLRPITGFELDKTNKRSTSVSILKKTILTEPDVSPRNFPFRPSINKLTHDLIKKPLNINFNDDSKLARLMNGYRGSKVIRSQNHSRNASSISNNSRLQTENFPIQNVNKIKDFKLNFGYKRDKTQEAKERLKKRTKSTPYLGTDKTLVKSIETRLNSSESNRSNNSSISFRDFVDRSPSPISKSPVYTTPFSARKFFHKRPAEMFSGLLKAPQSSMKEMKYDKMKLEEILIEGQGKVTVRKVLRPIPVLNNRNLFTVSDNMRMQRVASASSPLN